AHRYEQQILICASGRIEVELRCRGRTKKVTCRCNGLGLFVDRGVWSQQTYLEPDSRLLVLSSHPYDPDSYLDVEEDGFDNGG
ncbi:MAG: WxcM-like domain-containing protein, partial [Gammaproteobacteria bacterium]